jgi:hypothetical protein
MPDRMRRTEDEWQIRGDFVAGVIDDPAQVEAALHDLATEGIAEDAIKVFTGRSGSEGIDHLGGKGWLGQLRRDLEDYVGNAYELRARHQDEAERGKYVVIVNLLDSKQVDRALQVLDSHGGHDLVSRTSGFYQSR